MKIVKAIKSPWCFDVIPLNNVDSSLLQDNAFFLFLRLESLIELFVFHNSN